MSSCGGGLVLVQLVALTPAHRDSQCTTTDDTTQRSAVADAQVAARSAAVRMGAWFRQRHSPILDF